MCDASLVKLCFPVPPTPTSKALPRGCLTIRAILYEVKGMIHTCTCTVLFVLLYVFLTLRHVQWHPGRKLTSFLLMS